MLATLCKKKLTTIRSLLVSVITLATLVFLSCSNGDSVTNSGGGGGGGGGGREFVSGDLAPLASFTHVFDSAKVIPYYCRYHGGPGGQGPMQGVITVTAGGIVNHIQVSIVGNQLPDLPIDVGDTVTWTNNTTVLHTVESDN